jgi:hypothetical protein
LIKPICNIYCVSGTYGGYDGPSGMYSYLDPNKLESNIIRVHTSSDLKLCFQELSEVICEFNQMENLPILLVGWSQGGYTVIKAIEKCFHTPYFKKIKCICLISSRPENTEYICKMEGIHKYIICGNLDTERRMNGAKKMYEIASEPKVEIIIPNGTHNFEFQECFQTLLQTLLSILIHQKSRFV